MYTPIDQKYVLQHYTGGGGGGGGNGEMANLTNEKGKFAIAIFRHFSPLVVFEIKHFRH